MSLPSSHVLPCQQQLLLLYVTLPRFLQQPGSSFRVRGLLLRGRVPVRRRFRLECWSLCAILPVWLHLLKQILPCKRHCGTGSIASVCATVRLNLSSPFIPFLPSTMQLNEKFVTEDCSQSCECVSAGIVACEPKTCPDNYNCTVYNMKRDCHKGVCLWFLRIALTMINMRPISQIIYLLISFAIRIQDTISIYTVGAI